MKFVRIAIVGLSLCAVSLAAAGAEELRPLTQDTEKTQPQQRQAKPPTHNTVRKPHSGGGTLDASSATDGSAGKIIFF